MLCLFQVFYELFLENKDLFQYHYQLICPRVLQELNSFSQTNILQQSAQKGLFNKLVLLGACFNTHVDVFVTSINFIIFIIFQQKKLLEKSLQSTLESIWILCSLVGSCSRKMIKCSISNLTCMLFILKIHFGRN